MSLKYHGVEVLKEENKGYLHYGFIRLLDQISGPFCMRIPLQGKEINWPNKWIDRKFCQAIEKYKNTFWKLNRAAYNYANCIELIKKHRKDTKIEEFNKHLGAIHDIPLYLDMMIIYLRIQVDCIANIIPNLYGFKAKGMMKRDSFRDQINWFKKNGDNFDSTYKSIILTSTEWFDKLAGKYDALRELIIHYRGVFQVGWTLQEDGSFKKLKMASISDSGTIHDDVDAELKNIINEYFAYLDKIFIHYSELLRKEVGTDLIPEEGLSSRYVLYEDDLSISCWLYPFLNTD